MAADPPAAWSRRELLCGLGLGAAATLVGGGLAACSGPKREVPTPSVIRDVTSFGAVGDGHTDDTDAIIRALGALRPGQALRFPKQKVFCHRKVLTVTTERVQLLGPGALCATDEGSSALQIEAAHVILDGLVVGVEHTSRRWSTPDQHKLVLGGHEGIVVRDVDIRGSAAAGVFCLGTPNFLLHRVRVSDTRADGIHMTDGARDGTVESPEITRSGDDGVAVVSYLDDSRPCRNITVTNPRVRTTTGGRGLSVVGGQNITYKHIDVADSNAASVYIACEGGSSVTYPAQGVRVDGGNITGANTNAATDHGAVLVYSGRSDGYVSDVTVSGLDITNTRSTASRQVGVIADGHNPVSGIKFDRLRLAAEPSPYQGNAPAAAFVLSDVTAAGKSVQGSQ